MQLAWLPWLVSALLLANGIFSFALGYRSKRSIYVMAAPESQSTPTPTIANGFRPVTPNAATAVLESERVLVRPDLALFAENETLRDSLAAAEALISETEHALRETKAALARSEARIAEGDRVKVPLGRSVFAPRTRQAGGR
jgi:hypothetical protein